MRIKDEGLRRALHAALGRVGEASAEVDEAELAALRSLSWSEDGEAEAYPKLWRRVAELDGLERCHTLKLLSLGGNHVASLAPLAGLVNLEEIWIAGNSVRDLTPLAKLTRLRKLQLRENRVESLAGLEGLIALEELDLEGNPVVDLSVLASLPALRKLDLNHTKPRDLSALLACPALKAVSLYDVKGWTDEQLDSVAKLAAKGVKLAGPVVDLLAQRAASAVPASGAVGEALGEIGRLGSPQLLADWKAGGVHARDKGGCSLLHRVVLHGRVGEWVKVFTEDVLLRAATALIAEGASSDAESDLGETPLTALLDRTDDLPRLFALLLGAKPDLTKPRRKPPLAHAAAVRGQPHLDARFEALVAAGADLAHPAVLVEFAWAGDLAGVERALLAGASPDAQWRGRGALAEAVRGERVDVVRRLLEAGADPDRMVWEIISRRPIHEARTPEMLRLLLDAGADPAGRDSQRATLLHGLGETYAKRRGARPDEADLVEMGRILLAAGVSANDATSGHAATPLHAFLEKNDGPAAFVKLLLDAGADPVCPPPGGSSRDRAVAALLRAAGATSQNSDALIRARLSDPATMAVGSPCFRSLAYLLDQHRAEVPGLDAYDARVRALIEADDAPAARVIAKHHGEPRWIQTALAWLNGGRSVCGRDVIQCAFEGYPDNVPLGAALLDVLGPHRAGSDGHTTLDAVLQLDDPPLDLVRAAKTPLSVVAHDGGLERLASNVRSEYEDEAESAAAILEEVLDCIDFQAPPHVVALIEADRADLVGRALAGGFDPDTEVRPAQSALRVAIEMDSITVAACLLDAGAHREKGLLHHAQSPAAVRLLLAAGTPVDEPDGLYDPTPLLAAIEDRRPEVCAALLDAGADPDRASGEGHTFRALLSENDEAEFAPLKARLGLV